ncbi:histidine kinase [Dokdonia sinensis]|uniref:Histidine kinase n=1 Tax=Dokdonia sinensis TaxID=2479847 RepID=A0A3M0FUC3_9FLAO|nr:2TM domain-containing protein [Dokdonia sinensis]RMB56085.1 histidine kinase [Dokdonia sinensis]
METSRETKYAEAKEKVEKIRGFYNHLIIYLIFVGVFIFINYRSGAYFWAIFPIAGWGLGVLGHAAGTFDLVPFFGREWEKNKIKEFMEEDRNLF